MTPPEPKRYHSMKIVEAVPMIEHDYIISTPAIPSKRKAASRVNGYRQGYMVTNILDGTEEWINKAEFEREFAEVTK